MKQFPEWTVSHTDTFMDFQGQKGPSSLAFSKSQAITFQLVGIVLSLLIYVWLKQ